jgi:hypothetical protein
MQIEIITKQDLVNLKQELILEFKKILNLDSQKIRYVKSKELLAMLKISNTKLYELRNKGLIPYKKLGGTYLYSMEEVQKSLNQIK